ncbi:hypothetical protein JHK82_018630 [Glycine max]|nr:hypothetical protein JHK82_018630 [Glycine max]
MPLCNPLPDLSIAAASLNPSLSEPFLSRVKTSHKPRPTWVEHFIQAVGSYKDKIFLKRARLHQKG